MSARLPILLACVLQLSGCQRSTPPTTSTLPSGATSAAPATSPAANASADATAPIATLLGKPVYRHDCLSRSGGIGSAEVGFQRLILAALMDDFCQAQSLKLSQEEIETFSETLESAARRVNKDLPARPPFDEAKTQAQLDDVRSRLAAADTPWLERLALQGQERGHSFALEHKTVEAALAYENLMPLRCQAALYEKYGGKVVGMQISVEPIGAYMKLIQEAEESGKLQFHDDALKQAFSNRMNDFLQRSEVAPEFVDFSLPAWLQVSLRSPEQSTTTPNPLPSETAGSKGSAPAPAAAISPDMLGRFVGVWDLRNTQKPAKWLPEGGTTMGQESTVWALKNRVILIRDMSQPDRKKGLWIATYDPQQNAYPFLGFDSQGLMGAKWLLRWDDAASATVGQATDLPSGWTSGGKNHFPDADTNNIAHWIKDENGAMMLEAEGKKTRQADETGPAIVAAWTKNDSQDALSAELKVLDRMVGTWDTITVLKPAEWTPDGGRTTATVTREWILNGRVVLDTSLHSDGTESLALISFDPQSKAYRSWWFNSEGNRSQSQGSWDEASQTFSYHSDLEDGKTMQSFLRFASPNREDWQFKVTDADGKVCFDSEITATRREAAPAEEAAPAKQATQTDHNKFHGTWGAVTYVQDGQGAGEPPIAPQDSAIKYVFEETQFTLLASGNAGPTPQGSFQLGTSGNARTIDLNFSPDPGTAKGQSMQGIYKFEGDTLKICYALSGGKRPSEFSSVAGSRQLLMDFKRIQE